MATARAGQQRRRRRRGVSGPVQRDSGCRRPGATVATVQGRRQRQERQHQRRHLGRARPGAAPTFAVAGADRYWPMLSAWERRDRASARTVCSDRPSRSWLLAGVPARGATGCLGFCGARCSRHCSRSPRASPHLAPGPIMGAVLGRPPAAPATLKCGPTGRSGAWCAMHDTCKCRRCRRRHCPALPAHENGRSHDLPSTR